MDSKGEVVNPLDIASLEKLAGEIRKLDVESVAIFFMNSYINSSHEEAAAQVLKGRLPDVYVTFPAGNASVTVGGWANIDLGKYDDGNDDISESEIRERPSAWKPPAPRYASGVLAKYARLVSSASTGAVTG